MFSKKITLGLERSGIYFKPIFTTVLILILISLLAACTSPAATSQAPTSSTPAITTIVPTTTTTAAVKPQGALVGVLTSFGSENFLPWLDPTFANLHDIVYDLLIYWDNVNNVFLPGLAESWEVTPDGMTLTYHLRKGVQYHDGWGELTSADVKYNFEMQASPKSVGKVTQTRRIASMETPDPYTLIVHFKTPYPTFFVDLSMANSGVCQGIACKKYIETVGEEVASQKPIGTGPYKLLESKSGSYFKFEAIDDHWRVVPEFKTLTVRLMTEVSSIVAALKNKEIDMAQVPAEQMADLKAAGVAVEVSPVGGAMLVVGLGGMALAEDKRYDAAYHNKDPWVDSRVRKAMAIAIDREAICQAIYAGYADPVGVPLFAAGMEKYQYPYDPAAAKQLLKEAGYPDGFSFRAMSCAQPGSPEMPRLMEALAGYWQQIGLVPQITAVDYAAYNSKNRVPLKTAGDVSLQSISPIADMLAKAEIYVIPNGVNIVYQDEASFTIYKEAPTNATIDERLKVLEKLNQYYFDNVGPIPVVRNGYCFAWNSDKVSPWPHPDSNKPVNFEYVRHANPISTFRLFTPWPGR